MHSINQIIKMHVFNQNMQISEFHKQPITAVLIGFPVFFVEFHGSFYSHKRQINYIFFVMIDFQPENIA